MSLAVCTHKKRTPEFSVFTGRVQFKAERVPPHLILKHLGFGLFFGFRTVQILLTFLLPVVLCCSVRKEIWVSGQRRHFETLSPFGDSMLLGEVDSDKGCLCSDLGVFFN